MMASYEDVCTFGDDFLDEDCFDVNLECDFFEAISHFAKEVSSDSGSESGHQMIDQASSTLSKPEVRKSKTKKSGSKMPKLLSVVPVNDTVAKAAPTTPRRTPYLKLYVYPSFDKADSSLFLPSRLAKHLNSGNMASVSKLIQLHFDKNCKIDMNFMTNNSAAINPRGLIKWYGFVQTIHADSIMCVRQTTVSENQIKSVVYIKFTDNKALSNSVRNNVKDPTLKRILESEKEKPGTRGNPFKREDFSEEQFKELEAIHQSPEDKVVYLTQEMTLTINNLTSKVTGFCLVNRLTKLAIAPPLPPDDEL